MLVEYLGLIGMLLVAVGTAFTLFSVSRRLRKRLAAPSAPKSTAALTSSPGLAAGEPQSKAAPATSRYFFVAIVGLMLHAGSFYFYIWGASMKAAGLTGLMIMLGLGMCLMVGVFYSWARGAVSYATETEDEELADSIESGA